MKSGTCRTCKGVEFDFQRGPCPACNPIILGFAIEIKAAPNEIKLSDPREERDAQLGGIAEAIADSFNEIGQTVKKPY